MRRRPSCGGGTEKPSAFRFFFMEMPLLVTISIVAIVLFMAMIFLPRFSRQALQADLQTTAAYLAQEKLEEIIADSVGQNYAHIAIQHYLPESFSGDYAPYRRSTMIREVNPEDLMSSQAGSGYKRIDVRVAWGDGDDQRVELSSILTSR